MDQPTICMPFVTLLEAWLMRKTTIELVSLSEDLFFFPTIFLNLIAIERKIYIINGSS